MVLSAIVLSLFNFFVERSLDAREMTFHRYHRGRLGTASLPHFTGGRLMPGWVLRQVGDRQGCDASLGCAFHFLRFLRFLRPAAAGQRRRTMG